MAKRILIVDDDLDDLNLMKSILEKEGYEIDIATGGADALDNLISEEISLFILDIKMPTLSGYDVLRLSREKVNGHIKMVYCSVVPQKEVDMTNVDGFIQKPFTSESLLNVVKKVLE